MPVLQELRLTRAAGPTVLSRGIVVRLTGRIGDPGRVASGWPGAVRRLSEALSEVEVWTPPGAPDRAPEVRGGTAQAFSGLPAEIEAEAAGPAAGQAIAAIAAALMAAARAPEGARGAFESDSSRFFAYIDDWTDGLGAAALDAAARLFETAVSQPDVPLREPAAGAVETVRGRRLDFSISSMVAAAAERGVPWRLLFTKDIFVAYGQGARQRWMRATLGEDASYASVFTSLRKDLTNSVLRRAGFPVTQHRLVEDREQAIRAAEQLGFPVVIKPAAGSLSKNTALWVENGAAVAAAYAACGPAGTQVLVERQAQGEPHRLTVVGGRAVAATRQILPFVVGDGRSSLRELIAAWGRSVARPVPDDYAGLHPIDLDNIADHLARRLEIEGLTLDSVPEDGREVLLSYLTMRVDGGIALDVHDRIHPSILRMVEEIAVVTGLGTLGLDLITTDITRPLGSVPIVINEVNACPHLLVPELAERPRQPAPEVLAEAIPEGDQGRIPIAAFFGLEDPGVLDRLEDLLTAAGYLPGVATAAEARIDGYRLRPAGGTAEHPGRAVLRDRRPDVGLFSYELNDLSSRGAASDHADVVALTAAMLRSSETLVRRSMRALAGWPGELLLTPVGEDCGWLRKACPHRRWIAVAAPKARAKSKAAEKAMEKAVEKAWSDGAATVVTERNEVLLIEDGRRDCLHWGETRPGEGLVWALAALLGLGFTPDEIFRLASARNSSRAVVA